MNDPIADMLTRIRNSSLRGKSTVMTPASKLRAWVLDVLADEGYIRGYEKVTGADGHPAIEISLKYYEGEPVIRELKRVSKPGRRVYMAVNDIPVVRQGLGVSIVSTSKGVMSDASARAEVSGQTIEVKGPKGTRSFRATDDVSLAVEDNAITVTPRGKSKRARQQWGMSRTMIERAAMNGNTLKLNLGLSHDVDYVAPEGVTVTAPKQTEIVVEGIDEQLVGQVAANIRAWRKPEPYKGKGIRYKGEFIFRKEGKKK